MYKFNNCKITYPIYCEDNIIFKNCEIHKNVKIGKYSYANNSVFRSNIIIGRYTSIGRGCILGCGIHDYRYFTTSPYICFKDNNYNIDNNIMRWGGLDKGIRTKIGNDCWIGDHVIVFSGIEIGDGAVVGAGAVVNKHVKPYEIVVGCPARHLKFRFSDEIIKELLKIKWWEFDLLTINKVAYKNIKLFIQEISNIQDSCRTSVNYTIVSKL